jgi:uncharacterized protein YndB with AHSA1/START domain
MGQTTAVEPIRIEFTVACSVERAFEVFTDRMGTWWPVRTHAVYAEEVDAGTASGAAVLEGRVGGRIYERMADGREADWGRVLVWEPPRRLVMAWKPNTEPTPPTEVEVRFRAAGEGTSVELEHRGWERLGNLAQEARSSYSSGWPPVLDRFARAAVEA